MCAAAPICSLLLRMGACLEAQDQVGASALHLAAYRGHLEIVQQLLGSRQAAADGPALYLAQHTHSGEAVLMAAAKMGHLPVVKVGALTSILCHTIPSLSDNIGHLLT
jgi:ankyrin repeat protein